TPDPNRLHRPNDWLVRKIVHDLIPSALDVDLRSALGIDVQQLRLWRQCSKRLARATHRSKRPGRFVQGPPNGMHARDDARRCDEGMPALVDSVGRHAGY